VIEAPGRDPIENATVLIRDGRIEAVGVDLELPFDARAVDVRGLTLTAGWVDAMRHTELSFSQHSSEQGRPIDDGRDALVAMPEADRRGMAPEREAWRVLAPDASDLATHREAGFGALIVAPHGMLLSGTGAWLALSGRPPREALLHTQVAQSASLRWRSGPENYEGYAYPATLMGVMAHLRQVLLDAERHVLLAERYAAGNDLSAPPHDAVLEALAPVLAGEVPIMLEARSEEDVRLALGLQDDFRGLRIVITGGLEAWELAHELSYRGIGVIHDLDFGEEPEDPDDKTAKPGKQSGEDEDDASDDGDEEAPPEGAGSDSDDLDEAESDPEVALTPRNAPWDAKTPLRLRRDRHRRWLHNVEGVARLVEAGVSVAFGTRDRSPADLLESMRVAIDKGRLDSAAALDALTRSAHELLGGGAGEGEIRVGVLASLTAWSDEPTSEDAKARVLVVAGRLFDYRLDSDAEDDEKEDEEEEESDEESDEDDQDEVEVVAEWPVELDGDRVPPFHTGGDVFIRGATVLTASHGTLEDHDVIVRNGYFDAIGRGLVAPEGMRVVEAEGMTMMPGIIDCHAHTAIRGGINEWTRVVTPEVSIEDEVNPDDVSIYRALAGGVTSARLLHGSANAIGGRHEIIKLRWGMSAPELVFEGAPRGVKFALGENPKQSNYGGGSRFPKTRMGVEAVLRRSFEAASDYRAEWALHEARTAAGESTPPPRRDLRLEALVGILDGEIGVHSHCYQSDEMLMLMRVAEDFGFRVATLQHVLEGYKIASEIAAHGAGGSTFVDWWGYKFEAYDATPYCAALMTEGGVLMSVNSDSDEHLRRLYLEAAKTVKYGGVSEEAALRMVTLNPAIQLGIDDRVGSIDVGKDADFALFSRHPFDVRTRCLMTFIDGELFFRRTEGNYEDWAVALEARVEEARTSGETEGSSVGVAAQSDRPVPAGAIDALNLPRQATRAASTPRRPASEAVALVGGTVHTMELSHGELVVHSPGAVLMENGRIVDVIAGDGAPPPRFRVVDVTGSHVWPGMIDAGSSLGLGEISAVPGSMDRREIGGEQPDLRASGGWHAASEHIPVARVNGITSTLVVPSGGRIAGQSALMSLEGWTASEALIADAVALHIRAPRTSREDDEAWWVTVTADAGAHLCTAGIGPQAPALPLGKPKDEASSELGKRVEENWKELADLLADAREYARLEGEASDRGVPGPTYEPRLAALAPYALGHAPIVFEANWADAIADSLDFAAEQGLKAIISGGREAWKVADRLALQDVPVIIGPVLSMPMTRDDLYDSSYANAALLQRLGVRFCFRTNSSADARNLPYNAGMAVAYGLAEDDALYALTAGAADILGIEEHTGTLSPEKRADVIVTDDSPLQVLTSIQHVFIGGRDVGLESRHTRLYERYRSRLLNPSQPSR
jgi:imidazolonepropionase-like amidohydrolase